MWLVLVSTSFACTFLFRTGLHIHPGHVDFGRLTGICRSYAFEMVDQVYDCDSQDVSMEVSMITALGIENGTKPRWTPRTTRFQIWDHIAKAAYFKGLFIHPDLHIGKAQWYCSHEDGNFLV